MCWVLLCCAVVLPASQEQNKNQRRRRWHISPAHSTRWQTNSRPNYFSACCDQRKKYNVAIRSMPMKNMRRPTPTAFLLFLPHPRCYCNKKKNCWCEFLPNGFECGGASAAYKIDGNETTTQQYLCRLFWYERQCFAQLQVRLCSLFTDLSSRYGCWVKTILFTRQMERRCISKRQFPAHATRATK